MGLCICDLLSRDGSKGPILNEVPHYKKNDIGSLESIEHFMDNLYTIKICWEEEDRMKKISVEKPCFSSESHNEGERGKKNIFNGKTYQKFMYPLEWHFSLG